VGHGNGARLLLDVEHGLGGSLGGDSIGVGLVLQGYDEFDLFSWEAATWALATLCFALSL
jgi:hypothetical protein